MRTPTKSPQAAAMAPKLRAPAAAQFLGLAPATLAKLRCIGGGPPFTKLGRAVVYEMADLEEWVTSQGKRRSTSSE